MGTNELTYPDATGLEVTEISGAEVRMSAGVLAVMKADALAAQEWRFKKAGDAFAFAACKTSNEARATVAELIEVVSEAADEHIGPLASVNHDGPDDEVGCRVCCGVVSYAPHSTDCIAVRLRAALTRAQGGGK